MTNETVHRARVLQQSHAGAEGAEKWVGGTATEGCARLLSPGRLRMGGRAGAHAIIAGQCKREEGRRTGHSTRGRAAEPSAPPHQTAATTANTPSSLLLCRIVESLLDRGDVGRRGRRGRGRRGGRGRRARRGRLGAVACGRGWRASEGAGGWRGEEGRAGWRAAAAVPSRPPRPRAPDEAFSGAHHGTGGGVHGGDGAHDDWLAAAERGGCVRGRRGARGRRAHLAGRARPRPRNPAGAHPCATALHASKTPSAASDPHLPRSPPPPAKPRAPPPPERGRRQGHPPLRRARRHGGLHVRGLGAGRDLAGNPPGARDVVD